MEEKGEDRREILYRRVSRSSPHPLYWQVENDLRTKIESGVLTAGHRLPSEDELSSLYGASRITVRQAMANIASEGLISREPGRGTFVRARKLTSDARPLTSFAKEMTQLGYDIETRVVAQRVEPANATVANKLRLPDGAEVHRLDRLRLAGGQPLALQRSYLPVARFPGLEEADLSGSLYDYLESHFDARPVEADELIQVTSLKHDEEAAMLLGSESEVCAFVLERLAFDRRGPVDYSRSIVRGDRYQIHHGIGA